MAGSDLPLVSVVTPTYNRAHYLAEVIDSILAQDYPNVEYIVIDDGSTDATVDLLRRYDGRIHWETQPNMGETRTVNKGWTMARGEFVLTVSSDDPMLPALISASVETMLAHPDVLVTYPDWMMIDAQGNPIEHILTYDYDYIDMLRWHHCMPGAGNMIRRRAFELAGMRDTNFKYAGDFEYWLRLGMYGPFRRIPHTLALYRLHEGAMTVAGKGVAMAEEHPRMLDKLYSRPDVTPEMRRVRAEAYSAAHYIAGVQCRSHRPTSRQHFVKSILLHRNSFPNGLPRSWKLMLDNIQPELRKPAMPPRPLGFAEYQRSADAPAVSVVIPTYNRADLIGQAIDSVLAQTFDDYEIIVADDGSTDDTQTVIEAYGERVRYVRLPHGGVSAARNAGIEMAKGKYVAFLDSDDLFMPEKLHKQVGAMEADPALGMIYSSYNAIDADGQFIEPRLARRYPGGYRQMMMICTIAPSSVLVRRDVFETVGRFDTNMVLAEDIDLWCRIMRRFPVQVIDDALTEMRFHGGNTVKDPENVLSAYLYLLDKAFAADRSLGWVYRRRSLAAAFYMCAFSLIAAQAESGRDLNGTISAYFYRGARYWPLSRIGLEILATRINPETEPSRIKRAAALAILIPWTLWHRRRDLRGIAAGRAHWFVWIVKLRARQVGYAIRGRSQWLVWIMKLKAKQAGYRLWGRAQWLRWIVGLRARQVGYTIRGRSRWLAWIVPLRVGQVRYAIRGRGQWLVWMARQTAKRAYYLVRGRGQWLVWMTHQIAKRAYYLVRGRSGWLAWQTRQMAKRVVYALRKPGTTDANEPPSRPVQSLHD